MVSVLRGSVTLVSAQSRFQSSVTVVPPTLTMPNWQVTSTVCGGHMCHDPEMSREVTGATRKDSERVFGHGCAPRRGSPKTHPLIFLALFLDLSGLRHQALPSRKPPQNTEAQPIPTPPIPEALWFQWLGYGFPHLFLSSARSDQENFPHFWSKFLSWFLTLSLEFV